MEELYRHGLEGMIYNNVAESCETLDDAAGEAFDKAARVLGLPTVDFPQETAIGALGNYISGGSVGDFQPMNINFGIITPLDHRVKGKRNKNAAISERSLKIIEELKEKEVFHIEDNH